MQVAVHFYKATAEEQAAYAEEELKMDQAASRRQSENIKRGNEQQVEKA